MIRKYKKTLFLLTPIILLVGFFVIGPSAHAAWEWVDDIFIGILTALINALGNLLVLVIKGVIMIASYSTFIHSPAVTNGWVVVRDLCNMFFIVILLIIAFATILRLENYSYKKWLPKLMLMAILINFSKTICGILIDVSQIVMLTFVNAFRDVAGGNFIQMLGIYDSIQLDKNSITTAPPIGAYLLGVIYILISIVVLVTMMAMLAMRIVMIWIYVVLSPIAYLGMAFPGGQGMASKWWKRFIDNLIVGPVLAFFIWLSFVALQSDVITVVGSDTPVLSTTGSTGGSLIKFVIAIGMLIGGLKISQEIGGEAGSIAGKGMAAITKGQAAVGTFGKKWGKKVLSGDNLLARKTMKGIGMDFRPMKIQEAFQSSYAQKKKDDETDIRTKGRENMGKGGIRSVVGGVGAGRVWADNYVDGMLGVKGIGRAAKEIFINPAKREEIGGRLDGVDEDIKASRDILSGSMTNKQKKEKKATIENNELRIQEIDKDLSETENVPENKKKLDQLKGEKEQLATKNIEIGQDMGSRKFISEANYQATETNLKQKEQEKRALRKEYSKYSAPKSGESVSEYRGVINERKAKYKDITVAEELIDYYDDAVKRGDKNDQVALLEKISSDANLNEVLNAKGYDATSKGLYKFINNLENSHGQKEGMSSKFSPTELMRVQSDLGESEERVGHWEMAKMVGHDGAGRMVSTVERKVDKDGKEHWDDSKHVIAASSEIGKMDPQKILTMLNRLAAGGESSDGEYQFSNLGKVLVKMLDEVGTFASQGGRLQNNMARNLNKPHVVAQLKAMGITKETLDTIAQRSSDDPEKTLAKLKKVIDEIEAKLAKKNAKKAV